ncbi:MerR family transcriptional regulator [Kitasatospora sp. GAS204B]|uniref:MerR family transcriptional regulator n=1 Tax=unclassified Kitasatospora TaxID=2633591 RepID=UPI00247551D0|nr:MerR family transcriptional regulator [Kitasatospora sp. GAS204B]MDH6118107.1 DNA-binding transcriptional MerR regulator [Kitasatospora sp. GAS204B]
MRVSELAQRTGASPRALRHYDANGLLPSQRLANGYRDFPEQAIERVRRIRLLLAIGLDLEDVAQLLPCFAETGELTPCDRAQERLRGQIADIDAKMSALRATRRMLAGELRQWAGPPAERDPARSPDRPPAEHAEGPREERRHEEL